MCVAEMGVDQNSSCGGTLSKVANKLKPYLAMVSLQFGYSGMYIISMVSFKHGMSHYVLSVYRHVVAFILIAPFAFVLERSPLSFSLTIPISSSLLFLESLMN